MQEDKNIILRKKLPCQLIYYSFALQLCCPSLFLCHCHHCIVMNVYLMLFPLVPQVMMFLWWRLRFVCIMVCMWWLNCWLVCVDMHMLTAVESLEARVISRFPFMPNTAGTRMKISVISWNTSQFCRENTKCKIQLHTEGETQSRPQTQNESSTFSRWSLEVNTSHTHFIIPMFLH